ncbi:Txe/YoeB family addiction module toxin [Companilactobacillus mishanensis]|uniref:Endoribonuclease YoeB n=1 Tax=Companilactobacillus mishanensis TaxID=2486008 RepID=A0ABW9P661_9LACO|nr:Txe/YoeB family addiction module toxin [Companilactobacillus mishanensis]MQS44711.1 Txe/YoeB family addiction module toxin [Companilactobacillus mishanensis]MQS89815.1 Txe/YoeB family addiction module toxin [Companilactobacillus mishanensis]
MDKNRKLTFIDQAWNEYVYWQSEDKRTLKRINNLIKSIKRDGYNEGIGEPELLKYEDNSTWSRRIDKYNRLVYLVTDSHISIIQCKGHY